MQTLSHFLARFTLLRCLALLVLTLGSVNPVLAAKTYTINGDGTATDPTTGLTWMRCAMGQVWDGSTCGGSANSYTFDQANALTGTLSFASMSDWRLPSIRDLLTIVDREVVAPAIDSKAFPATPKDEFWSGSLYAYGSDSAWSVYFYDGTTNGASRIRASRVRMVRGGQPLGLLGNARLTTDYVDHGDGTATHTPSGLMWQRCAIGQIWTGSTCSGSASTMKWTDAMSLTSTSISGRTDWRLPTADELLSLVDYNRVEPAINSSIFPNTPSSTFWTSSLHADYPYYAFAAKFSSGFMGAGSRSWSYSVRLVRSGQSFGSLATNADRVLDWAERTYPTFFSPINSSSQSIPGYRYRAYRDGGYLGVSDSAEPHLLYIGPFSGGALLDLGPLSSWLTQTGL
jgi:hypothetical protein